MINKVPSQKFGFPASYWKLFFSRILSRSSGSIFSLLILWIAFIDTHSGLVIAIIGISQIVSPAILSAFLGNYVDVLDRRKIMMVSQIVRASVQLSFFIYIVNYGFNLIFSVILLFSYSTMGILYHISESSYLPDIIDHKKLQNANGFLRTSSNVSGIVSTAVAGVVIILIGATRGLLITAPEFLVSGIFLINLQRVVPKERILKRMRSELSEGFHWLLGMRGLFFLTISAMTINFFYYVSEPFYVVFNGVLLGGSSIVFALMLAFYTLGDIFGTLISGKIRSIRYTGFHWTMVYGFTSGVLIFLMTVFHNYIFVLAINIFIGACAGIGGNTWLSYAQKVVPSEMRGRYFGIDSMGSYAIMPLGEAIGGLMITFYGVYFSFIFSAVGLMTAGLGFFAIKSLRHLGNELNDEAEKLPS
ncbi:MAG: MFS transporter [Thermoplasmataceae archaeon]